MIGYDVDGGAGPFEVVTPTFEGIVDGRKFFIMNVVIGFGIFESPGVECNQVVVTIWGSNEQYGSQCIARGISLYHNWCVRNPVCEYRGGDECFLELLKGLPAVVGEDPWDVLSGEPHEWDCDFRVAVNEMAIEIGKPEEGHHISDFLGFGPVLDGLDFVLGHQETIGG